ncbi:TetR/AcrR family transcriptional regulator [Streptomyces sp. NPDC050264]|uniref:SbtR family transcriptional regulator n=1 Tax=Streptomyces sp. NPDC050264 TaxID=3155038 RepID=UPI003434A551
MAGGVVDGGGEPGGIAGEGAVVGGLQVVPGPADGIVIDAAYRRQPTQVCEKVNDLLAQHPAAEATRLWMEHFIHYATAKRGMSEGLNAVIVSGIDPYSDSRALLTDAARDGTLRTDVTPENVLLLMGGIAYSVRHGTKEQARPLVDLFMDALTKHATAS